MGKGRIVSHLGDGLYNVELLHNRDRITLELEFLAARLTELQAELDTLNTEREAFVLERNAIATEIDTAVANAEEGEIPDVEALLTELAQVSARIQAFDVRIAMIQGRQLEARKRQQMLQSVPADPVQQAWCADFTEDLTGEVATVEVPAEGVVGQFLTWRRAQIRPGHGGGASYNATRDGQMFHREGQTGYQAYFNAAILPGVQRWRPQYRIGTITAIDREADTCTLTIQGESSSAQSLILDPPDLQYTKTGVPIEYMDCDALAFEEGDRVLVEFAGRSWDAPKVVGFESSPRQCLLNGIICTYQGDLYLLRYEGQWVARKVPLASGRVGLDGYWRGTDGEIVSWGAAIYWRDLVYGRPSSDCRGASRISEVLRAVDVAGSAGRDLRVNRLIPVFGTWTPDQTVVLTINQKAALPSIVPFTPSGDILLDVLWDLEGYTVSYTGGLLTITEIPVATSSSTTEWEITTLFESCGSLAVTNGSLVNGSYSRTTGSGSTTRTINGLSFTHNVASFSEQVWPAAQTAVYSETLTCAAIGLSGVMIDSFQLQRIIGVYMQPGITTAVILVVQTVVANDPGSADALAITRSDGFISGDIPYWRVTSRYHVLDGVLSAPLSTVKTYLGTTYSAPLSDGIGPASCASRTCSPQPCSETDSGSSSSSGVHPWQGFLRFRTIVVPTDADGRYLLTSDITPNESRLKDGDPLDLLGSQDDYLPASVIDWKPSGSV
jgi:hypothetical protein